MRLRDEGWRQQRGRGAALAEGSRAATRETREIRESDSWRFGGERLDIEGNWVRMCSIPHNIGLEFQFQILKPSKQLVLETINSNSDSKALIPTSKHSLRFMNIV